MRVEADVVFMLPTKLLAGLFLASADLPRFTLTDLTGGEITRLAPADFLNLVLRLVPLCFLLLVLFIDLTILVW